MAKREPKRVPTLMERRLKGETMVYENVAPDDLRADMHKIINAMGANFLGEWSGTKDEALAYMEKYFPRSVKSALKNMDILTIELNVVEWHSAHFDLKYIRGRNGWGIGCSRVFIGTAANGDRVESIFYQAFNPEGSNRYYRVNDGRQLGMSYW